MFSCPWIQYKSGKYNLAKEYACKHFYIDTWFVNDSLVIQTIKKLE